MTDQNAPTVKKLTQLKRAVDGSYYTIVGVGEPFSEWIRGYENFMEKEGIGKPTVWYTTTGEAVNDYAQPTRWRNSFQADLHFLLFPLKGLDIGKLAIFKIKMEDRWFDDIVQNMRRSE